MKIVIKLGTNVLTKNNEMDSDYISDIVSQVSSLIKEGHKVVIVTSGAIGFGSMHMGLKQKSRDIKMKQALAAVGQSILMEEYAKHFTKYKLKIAQLLLTYDVFTERTSNLNLRNCLDTLLKLGVIPIINENDVTSIDEIGTKFGDNDKLSAMVASKLEADLLILMTDIDGFYDKNPKRYKEAKKIGVVHKITASMESAAEGAGSSFSVGGMKSKILACKIATSSGCDVYIVDGRVSKIILKIMQGSNPGTLFKGLKKLDARERWILDAKPKGTIFVNALAEKILLEGKSSLLPVGVVKVEGHFKKGSVVLVNDFSKGVVELSSDELQKIKGLKSSVASVVLGRKLNEAIKKENLVFL